MNSMTILLLDMMVELFVLVLDIMRQLIAVMVWGITMVCITVVCVAMVCLVVRCFAVVLVNVLVGVTVFSIAAMVVIVEIIAVTVFIVDHGFVAVVVANFLSVFVANSFVAVVLSLFVMTIMFWVKLIIVILIVVILTIILVVNIHPLIMSLNLVVFTTEFTAWAVWWHVVTVGLCLMVIFVTNILVMEISVVLTAELTAWAVLIVLKESSVMIEIFVMLLCMMMIIVRLEDGPLRIFSVVMRHSHLSLKLRFDDFDGFMIVVCGCLFVSLIVDLLLMILNILKVLMVGIVVFDKLAVVVHIKRMLVFTSVHVGVQELLVGWNMN